MGVGRRESGIKHNSGFGQSRRTAEKSKTGYSIVYFVPSNIISYSLAKHSMIESAKRLLCWDSRPFAISTINIEVRFLAIDGFTVRFHFANFNIHREGYNSSRVKNGILLPFYFSPINRNKIGIKTFWKETVFLFMEFCFLKMSILFNNFPKRENRKKRFVREDIKRKQMKNQLNTRSWAKYSIFYLMHKN